MRRMSREFSLVVLGSGMLTAGYFAYPEADLQAKAEQQAVQRVAAARTARTATSCSSRWAASRRTRA
jgi:hypothetical protein